MRKFVPMSDILASAITQGLLPKLVDLTEQVAGLRAEVRELSTQAEQVSIMIAEALAAYRRAE